MQHVQRIPRHADIKLTVDAYGHLVVEDQHDSVGHLPAIDSASPLSGTPQKAPGLGDFSRESEGVKWPGRQDSNLRPLGPELPEGAMSPVHTGLDEVTNLRDSSGSGESVASTDSQRDAENARRLSPLSPPLSGFVSGRKQWLSVDQVAVLLEVSRATVYRLVQDRRLGHVRISNAVKVHVEQLRAFVRQNIKST
jgi:excisionase family DNA binding protein